MTTRTLSMSRTPVSIARMEVPAHASDVSYEACADVFDVAAYVADVMNTPKPANSRLAIHVLERQSSHALAGQTIARLQTIAATLANPTDAILRVFKDSLANRSATLWFDYEFSRLRPISLHQVAEVSSALQDRAGKQPGVMVELQIGQAEQDLAADAVLAAFQQTLRLSVEAVQAHATATDPTVIVAGAATRDDPGTAAAQLRDEMLQRGWPTSAQVGLAHGSKAGNAAQWAADKRAAGELLGVWSANERTYRHPEFQFVHGQLHPKVRELLAALALQPSLSAKHDPGGWRRAFWLHGTTPDLADPFGQPRTPAGCFMEDPDAVIALARKEAEVDLNAQW